MRRNGVFGLLVAAALVVAATAAWGAGSAPASASAGRRGGVVISTRKVPKPGTVLVNGEGLTLYMFVPDKRVKVTCKGTCAVVWPPLLLPKGARAQAAGKAEARLLRSDPDPAGGRVVTYNGWPLYTYVGDRAPGQVSGQALNLNGGLWYVLTPSGKVIRKKP